MTDRSVSQPIMRGGYRDQSIRVRALSKRTVTTISTALPFEEGRSRARRTHRGYPMQSVIVITSAHWNNVQL
ncbi:hypothetical protein CXG50_05155 [Pseudomonas plecoglossicida]|uniref:Uncharacterized protein n=1 Tax=Pseudomonas plecoglossicida TaxID=70775 RepID=A0ABX4U2D1_PSEDL|nr:hypothetical protein CSW00_04110 [Pseudomonas sp. MR 02]PLU87982.1 hypothetical protein CXG44_07800 [Pseudomonas plecoglossicida]QKK97797.1 hypothetical protein GEV38_18265 [Pseudomonas sp. 13159349]TXI07090.1 MAG: hypothetical protein E6Q70_06245 [Pseudomonas monteilii]PLU95687.1 hypothetical protein CXG45_01230 [Pseudomonas plecoglossicida]